MPPYLADFVQSLSPCRFSGMRWHFPISIPLCSFLAYPLPPLILVALLPFLRLSKLLRRFVQPALGNFGGLSFHASLLTTLFFASQP